jgi:hypothetical protein
MTVLRHPHLAQMLRCGLTLTVLTLTGATLLSAEAIEVGPPASDRVVHESKERPDIPDGDSPKGLRVVQISTDPSMISHHLYPEAHMFTPDCRRFIFHRMPTDEKGAGAYWLCDIDDDFGLRKIIDERGAGWPSVSPDGRWAYYLIFDREDRGLRLKRVSLTAFHRETLTKIEGIIPGCKYELETAGGLTSISSDGKRLCTMAELHTGSPNNRRYGIVVIDLEKLSAHVAFEGDHEFLNMHLQYCRSLDPVLSHDILVQHNHGGLIDKDGRLVTLTAGAGADLHVVRDEGARWRDVPVGRDGTAFCTGHQQWRGRMPSVISSMSVRGDIKRHRLYEATPVATDDATSHKGSAIPGTAQNDLTRTAPETNFSHFCVDASGMRLAARHDPCPGNPDVKVYIASFRPGQNAALKVQYLLNTRWQDLVKGWQRGQSNKPRPILSPDAGVVLFHTDRDGKSEIFLVDRYAWP